MLKGMTRVCIVIAGFLGSAFWAGCYSEATIDQVNDVPSTKADKEKLAARPTQRPENGRAAAKTATTQDANVRRTARGIEEYGERLRKGSTDAKPGLTGAKKGPSAQTAVPSVATPSDSKRAAHVDTDTLESGQSRALKSADVSTPTPTQTPAPTETGDLSKTEPAKPAPMPEPPVAKPPTMTPPKVTPAPETPTPAPAPVKSVTEKKPSSPVPTSPFEKKAEPAKPVPQEVKKVAAPAAQPKPTPKVEPKPPTTPPGQTGFQVPAPPTIETKPAKSRRQQVAKAPPTAANVTVKAPEKTKAAETPGKVAQPMRPAETTPLAKQDLKALIDEKLKEVAANPNDLEKQMVLRLLYLADNQPKNAVAEIPGTNAPIQAIIDRLMRVNITAYQSKGRDPAVAATKLLSNVEELREFLMKHADLDITTLKLCTKVDGFGVYEEVKSRRFPARPSANRPNRAIVYCEVKNFTAVPTEDSRFRVLLAQKIKVLNKDGDTVFETADEDIPFVSHRRLEDFFLVQLLELPTNLPPGKYVLRTYIEDKLAAKAQEKELPFELTQSPGGK
ncbi:MAG: hypothetical protein JXQ73_21425 [Phycisphaerae bacterium]|nr:hypothetical protein [Phycisphaerae bacterium]